MKAVTAVAGLLGPWHNSSRSHQCEVLTAVQQHFAIVEVAVVIISRIETLWMAAVRLEMLVRAVALALVISKKTKPKRS